ncbi:MAG: CHAT domain-containing protein [Cytophagales bacterium]|nr:MAG: CHAT domain-containing protein [Cytophagales bacterium]TAF61503.1 MAG: CHAT domain-containing protein [Cytophagales bacterium]
MKALLTLLCVCLFWPFAFGQSWLGDLKKADSLIKIPQYSAAVQIYEALLPLIEKDSGKQSLFYLRVRNDLGYAYVRNNGKEAPVRFLRESIAMSKAINTQSDAYAESIAHLGYFFIKTANYDSAEVLYKESLYIKKSVLGEKSSGYAVILGKLGFLYQTTAKYAISEQYHQQALYVWGETHGKKHHSYASALHSLGIVNYYMANYPVAAAHTQEGAAIRKDILGENHPDYLNSIDLLAVIYRSMGQYDEAERLHKEVCARHKALPGKKHDGYVRSLSNLASLYLLLENYTAAETYYNESIKVQKELFSERNFTYADLLNNLGALHFLMSNYKAAEAHYKKSIDLTLSLVGNKDAVYARAMHNLAEVYRYTDRFIEADTLFKKSIALRREVFGEKHLVYAQSLGGIAELNENMGNFTLADSLRRSAIAVYQEAQGDKHPEYAYLLGSLAYLYTNMGRYKEADSLQKACLDIQKATLSRTNRYYINSLNNLAFINLETGDLDAAYTKISEVKDLCLENFDNKFAYLSAFQRENYYRRNFSRYLNTYLAFGIAMTKIKTDDLFDVQLATKAALMQANQKMKTRILNSNDTALIQKYKEWNTLKGKIIKASEMTIQERIEKSIDMEQLEEQSENLDKELTRRSQAFAVLTDKTRPTWQDIQKTLKKGEAAVEMIRINKFGLVKTVTDTSDVKKAPNFPQYPIYGLTDTIYYAALLVTAKSKQPQLVLLKNGNDLEGKYLTFQKNAVLFQQEDEESYAQFWKPIAEALQQNRIKKVYFSPDGVYNQISMNTLYNPESQKYLLNEINLHIVTSTKDILAFGKSESKTLRAELLGYPIYDFETPNADEARQRELEADTTRAFANFQKVSLLPGTKTEVENISGILKTKNYDLEVLIEGNATEENIKKVKNPKILHLSTHGFFISKAEKNRNVNPMLRCGLLFAGVSDYVRAELKPEREDGVLTALEAANLDLDETDLVVLSACETGLGDVEAGEGVYGLQRAFKVAGAKTIVMSMWKVDDTVTQKLMTLFYQKFAQYNHARKAFKEAQAEIKKQYPQPYYWGAFVMSGE